MPELPEIETITRGIQELVGQKISNIMIRQQSLRYPIASDLKIKLISKKIITICRRAKYIIIKLDSGFLIIHLGMSGCISLTNPSILEKKHDHFDLICGNNILRYNDPRRFGCIIYTDDIEKHKLFASLGPEPLSSDFTAKYLIAKIKNRNSSIKQLIMDNNIVVGVGNIYACEALFKSQILPIRAGKTISNSNAETLVKKIKEVLKQAIKLGGSSLRDYKQTNGNLGNFQNEHYVYGRTHEKCKICSSLITAKRIGGRNSFYCPNCQL